MDEFMQKKQQAYIGKAEGKERHGEHRLLHQAEGEQSRRRAAQRPALRDRTSKAPAPRPKPTETVKVHYTGKLIDGTVFDSSVQRGEPAEFPLDQVIPGWTEGIQKMNKGGKIKLYVPPQLAYGDDGRPGIPPSSTLIFDVELLDIKAAGAAAGGSAAQPAKK